VKADSMIGHFEGIPSQVGAGKEPQTSLKAGSQAYSFRETLDVQSIRSRRA